MPSRSSEQRRVEDQSSAATSKLLQLAACASPHEAMTAGLQSQAVLPWVLLRSSKAKDLARSIKKKIEADDIHTAATVAAAFLALSRGLVSSNSYFSDQFRPSIYPVAGLDSKLGGVEAVLTLCLESTVGENLAQAHKALASWRAFVQLYRRTRLDEAKLIAIMGRPSRQACSASLALAEFAFINPPTERPRSPKSFDELSREDVLTAASYSLEAAARNGELSLSNFGRLSPRFPTTEDRLALFQAHKLGEVLDKEADVFRAGYQCSRQAPGWQFRIDPPSALVGKSLEYGYLLEHQHKLALARSARPREALSFEVLIRAWVDALNHRYAVMQPIGGLRRFGFALPDLLPQQFGATYIAPDTLLAEEVVAVREVATGLHVASEALLEFRLSPNLRLIDVIKVQRILRLLTESRVHRLRESDVTNEEFWNSLVAGQSTSEFENMLCRFGLPPAAVKEWIENFTWDSSSPSFLDLQYTPAVRVDGSFGVLGAVACNSNLLRNGMLRSENRPWSNSDEEMIGAMSRAFNGIRNGVVRTDRSYRFDADEGQIDCAVLVERTLFVFECKRTLPPCSAFERRTTIDCLNDAAEQLERVARNWENSEFRAVLASSLEIDLTGVSLVGCIVLSHRLFSGASWKGWPIRQSMELANFVASGEGEFTLADVTVPVRLRAAGDVSGAQLADYLGEEAALLAPRWAAMGSFDEVWQFMRCEVRVPRFGFNWLQFALLMGLVPVESRGIAERAAALMNEHERGDNSSEAELNALSQSLFPKLRSQLQSLGSRRDRADPSSST